MSFTQEAYKYSAKCLPIQWISKAVNTWIDCAVGVVYPRGDVIDVVGHAGRAENAPRPDNAERQPAKEHA